MRECWEKDKEMNEMRKKWGKGDTKGGKGGYGGKGVWGGMFGNKGNWNGGGWNTKGWGKGKGDKGKGKGMYSFGNQVGPGPPWSLSLEKAPISAPPGLQRGFESVRIADLVSDGDYTNEFPSVEEASAKKEGSKGKMKPMGNYSKSSVRRTTVGYQPKEKAGKAKECHVLTKVPVNKELSPFVGTKPDGEGWLKITGVMDSGASESVAPPTMCPHVEIKPSPGSMAGQHYMSASEELLPNLGEQELSVVTDHWEDATAKYQIADVVRPLNAVSEICDAGGKTGNM